MCIRDRFPFATTEQERRDNGDPRPSIEARYRDHEVYIQRIREAVEDLVNRRLLLDDDAETYIKAAELPGSDSQVLS